MSLGVGRMGCIRMYSRQQARPMACLFISELASRLDRRRYNKLFDGLSRFHAVVFFKWWSVRSLWRELWSRWSIEVSRTGRTLRSAGHKFTKRPECGCRMFMRQSSFTSYTPAVQDAHHTSIPPPPDWSVCVCACAISDVPLYCA